MKSTYIYSLNDPETGQPRYIGKSNDPQYRLTYHIGRKEKKSKKESWIHSLKSKGLKPILEIIDEVPDKDWKFWEIHYISLYRSWGFSLTNGTEGGDGVSTGNIPWNKGLTGIYSKETIEKIRKGSVGNTNGKNRIGYKHTEETKKKISQHHKTKGGKYGI